MKIASLNRAKAVKAYEAKRRAEALAHKEAGTKPKRRSSRTIKGKPTKRALRTRCEVLCREYNKLVTPGCVAAGYTFRGKEIPCQGDHEWCHLKGRSNVSLILHPLNFTRLCKHHHYWFTNHPNSWTEFIEDKFPGRWQRLDDYVIEGHRGADAEEWLEFYKRKIRELKEQG